MPPPKKRLLTLLSVLAVGMGGILLWPQQPAPPLPVSVPVKPAPPPPRAEPVSMPQPARLRFAPQSGQTLAYRFDMASDSRIDFSFITPAIEGLSGQGAPAPQAAEKTPVSMQASGELHLKYYADAPDRWHVAAQLAGLNYRLNGQVPGYAEALAQPFAFQMRDTGFLSEFRFTRGVPPEAQQFTQQLLYALQTAFPEENKSAWQTKELDMTGRYRADYTLAHGNAGSATLTKRKTEYFTLKAAEHEINPALSRSRLEIGESLATITVPRAGAWLLNLEQAETTRSLADGHLWAENRNHLSAQQIERDLRGVFPEAFDGFLARLKGADYLKRKYYLTDTELDRLGANLDMNAALDVFVKLKNAAVPNAARNAEKFLVNYLRQHPQAAFALVDALDADPKRERFDESSQLVLWRLLTEAGHSEAQQAVAGALADPARSHITHMRALAYVSDFEYPETATVQALWQFYQGLGAPQDKTGEEFKTMTLLALGSLGSSGKLNDSVKPEIGQRLGATLQSASEPRDQAAALRAIGNYGGTEMLDTLESYFSVEQENVRAAAYGALRHMQDPRAVEILASHYQNETSPAVRAAAAKTLSQMPPSPTGVAWARQAVLNTDAPKAQIPLVEVLGKTMDTYPENADTLRALLQQNPDSQVKREIYKYIAPGL